MLKNTFLFIVLMICTSSYSFSQKFEHSFEELTFIPTFDDYCYRRGGELRITNVTKDSLTISVEVQNYEFEGGLECRAHIEGSHDAKFIEVHGKGEDAEVSEFTFKITPTKDYLYIEYSGPGFMYSGAGVCLSGFYKRND